MFVPLFAVTLGLMGCVSAKTDFTAARVKALGPNHAELPDLFNPKNHQKKNTITPSATYSTTGWVSQSYYDSGNCQNKRYTEGSAVNSCMTDGNGQSYKYQITSSDCATAVIQSFSDSTCTTLVSTDPPPMPVSGCNADSDDTTISMDVACTTDSNPNLGLNGVYDKYYSDTACANFNSYSVVADGICYDDETTSSKFSCDGSTAKLDMYGSSTTCSGTAITETFPTACRALTGSNDDSDDYTNSMTTTCTSGAGVSFLLDARAIAALVIGGITLLAL